MGTHRKASSIPVRASLSCVLKDGLEVARWRTVREWVLCTRMAQFQEHCSDDALEDTIHGNRVCAGGSRRKRHGVRTWSGTVLEIKAA